MHLCNKVLLSWLVCGASAHWLRHHSASVGAGLRLCASQPSSLLQRCLRPSCLLKLDPKPLLKPCGWRAAMGADFMASNTSWLVAKFGHLEDITSTILAAVVRWWRWFMAAVVRPACFFSDTVMVRRLCSAQQLWVWTHTAEGGRRRTYAWTKFFIYALRYLLKCGENRLGGLALQLHGVAMAKVKYRPATVKAGLWFGKGKGFGVLWPGLDCGPVVHFPSFPLWCIVGKCWSKLSNNNEVLFYGRIVAVLAVTAMVVTATYMGCCSVSLNYCDSLPLLTSASHLEWRSILALCCPE